MIPMIHAQRCLTRGKTCFAFALRQDRGSASYEKADFRLKCAFRRI